MALFSNLDVPFATIFGRLIVRDRGVVGDAGGDDGLMRRLVFVVSTATLTMATNLFAALQRHHPRWTC